VSLAKLQIKSIRKILISAEKNSFPTLIDLIIEKILNRSICAVKVGAIITDPKGYIISVGWNHMGASGYGTHAEHHAMSRANADRLEYSTIYVAASRKRTGKPVTAKPCDGCQPWLDLYKMRIVYRDGEGKWRSE